MTLLDLHYALRQAAVFRARHRQELADDSPWAEDALVSRAVWLRRAREIRAEIRSAATHDDRQIHVAPGAARPRPWTAVQLDLFGSHP